jgi:hypothetical protein
MKLAECPPDEHEAPRQRPLDPPGEVAGLRLVGQVVVRKPDGVRAEVGELAGELGVVEQLQVQQPALVAGPPRRLGDQLQPDRLELGVDLRIHQPRRMDISPDGWTKSTFIGERIH